MIKIVEVGIPVYKARATLPDALDSLVAQTCKKFITCLSIDCDGEDYSDIVDEYRRRGLCIRIINGITNGGPAAARQRVLDTTQAQWLMYLDADDIFMPRAVEILSRECRVNDYDIIRSSILKESRNDVDNIMKGTDNVITWMHGKCYKVQYLRDKKINFPLELRSDEDAYFNAVAWNATDKRGITDEVLYLWRDNPDSITRSKPQKEYMQQMYNNYITGQVMAMNYLHKLKEVNPLLVTNTLLNIYYYYMNAKFYGCDLNKADTILRTLADEEWMQEWLNEGSNWIEVVRNIKAGNVYENAYVVFFQETFSEWASKLFKKKIKPQQFVLTEIEEEHKCEECTKGECKCNSVQD